RPCNWDEDIDALINIYDDFNKSRSGTAIRSREYWMQWVNARSGNGSSFLIADAEVGISGYIQCNHDAENIWLREIGYRTDDCATAERLINAAISEAYSEGVRTLWCHLPDELEILDILFNNTELIEKRYSSGGMYRIINIESMLNRLRPELSERLTLMKAPSCMLRINANGEIHETLISGYTSEEPVKINLDWRKLISLLFDLNDTQPDGDVENTAVMEALFHRNCSISWSLDHF
ncbi:MAG: GNAT family N-acetyltransferase, partial [Armatimonadota bacterium]